ncbi:MocR-like pyridoxine biosynthesis transcription factor PdxR [Rhizobium multihospitium]|uniref:GntR family transcriptional regulator / MocR family aminotransferase n=1 Tax=Rhizobium multihospitium TaxID=410764 RepID=A0A1C3XDQ1_9HYPH|nr:PLP-dependent aminotransferase family protein [Rhizobium multihospitium]SCB50427.1 GntR family transcriptional regulator / MocR family aminotransferase [Rhizobium multihospitium]
MSKKISDVGLPSLGAISRTQGPIGEQLIRALRNCIAKGELKPGEKLPSTRALARSLRMSRGTVMEAFDQLKAEGYLEGQAGASTRVSLQIEPRAFAAHGHDGSGGKASAPALPANVERFESVARALRPQDPMPFAIAVPTGAIAPDDHWRRIGNRVRGSALAAPSGYGDPRGVRELRVAIADYLRKSRAVSCDPNQIIITAGTQQGLYLSASVLFSPGDSVWAEDPAYHGLTAVLNNFDCRVHRLTVDRQGIDVQQGIERCAGARAAFVTPSHQYPLGMPLSMARRTSLLNWARDRNSWIVEDDYDSELRYVGHPFPALQGLDPDRVIYLGTFSKVLFPSLRIGYAVVPPALVDAFVGARAIVDRHMPIAEQHALAAYMREGHFEAHIRRIRVLYADRRAALLDALQSQLPSCAQVDAADQGMHIVVSLPADVEDTDIAERARATGLTLRAISPMYATTPRPSALMLGFGGFTSSQLRSAVEVFCRLLATYRNT